MRRRFAGDFRVGFGHGCVAFAVGKCEARLAWPRESCRFMSRVASVSARNIPAGYLVQPIDGRQISKARGTDGGGEDD